MKSALSVTTADVLRLVQDALERFDVDPLDASLRRSVRIASLLGETRIAVRLGLELKPSGGHPPANVEMTRRLMADPDKWADPYGLAEAALQDFIDARRMDDGNIAAHSVDQLMFWEQHTMSDDERSASQYETAVKWKLKRIERIGRIRHETFTCLHQWERRLPFATTQECALHELSVRVDSLVSVRVPDVLEQFNVPFRRLREADTADSQAASSEALSQCFSSCRRILRSVVYVVKPAPSAQKVFDDGHALTNDKYKNRLFQFLKSRIDSTAYLSAIQQDVESLYERFSAVDSLSSKGFHASVAPSEAEFVALHTYLLAGQIISIAETDAVTREKVFAPFVTIRLRD